MKPFPIWIAAWVAVLPLHASERAQNTVILDANTEANLRLDFAQAESRVFEKTLFTLGRLEPRHDAVAVATSRIPGRIISLSAHLGDVVEAGEELMHIESRQAGESPPIIILRAPRAGTITACEVHLGDPVDPDRHLVEITDLSSLEAVAHVPEHAVHHLHIGATTRLRIAAHPDQTFLGELVRFAPAANPDTGTLAAHFRLPNPDGLLRPGLRAEFSLVLSRRPDVLTVPRAAVQGEATGPRFVFVRDYELPHAFVKTPVVLGETNDQFVEILDGLYPGYEVVHQGAYSLAFAGRGAVSLREALDAAHGHAHAEDGSDLDHPPHAASHGHHHDNDGDHHHPERPWQITTALFALATLALSLALARRRHA